MGVLVFVVGGPTWYSPTVPYWAIPSPQLPYRYSSFSRQLRPLVASLLHPSGLPSFCSATTRMGYYT